MKDVRIKWTEAEDAFLREQYPAKGIKYCADKFGRKEGSIKNRARRLGLIVDLGLLYGYSKSALQEAVKTSFSYTEVCKKLDKVSSGATHKIIKKRIVDYEIDTSHFDPWRNNRGRQKKKPIEEYLVEGSSITSSNLKEKLYKARLKERQCEMPDCDQGEIWKGKKISLILDHINGVNDDNRLENLRIVCPNCNAALPTHCKGSKVFEKTDSKAQKRKEKLVSERKQNRGRTDAEVKASIRQRKAERPPLSQLRKEVYEMGYSSTGRKYGVSDNAVRKWLK